MKNIEIIKKIEQMYLGGVNIINYLKKIENRRENDVNDIMISYTDGGKTHYAIVNVTLGLNTKAKDYASKSTTINNGMKVIVNAVQTEAMKYTYSTIAASKTTMESNLLATLQDTFQTECITSVIVSVVVQ